jgi:hypothetical protein
LTKIYIIFRHVENFKIDFFKRFFVVKKNEASFGIFENILFFEKKIFKIKSLFNKELTNLLFNYCTLLWGHNCPQPIGMNFGPSMVVELVEIWK